MSVLERVWKIRNRNESLNTFEKVLANRGLKDPNEAEKFINELSLSALHDPYLFPDMQKSVDRIKKAIENEEKIMIFGDYDVDGISGTAMLVQTLRELGAQVSYRLPHRVEDGYGMTSGIVEEFKDINIGVLITVDTGIASYKEIKQATEAGIDVIITDHHTIPDDDPDMAFAILHPRYNDCPYPFNDLSGAGVAFKLASALYQEMLDKDEAKFKIYELTDIASLGTVADCVPLVGENRVILRNGLKKMKESPHQGLQYLMENAGIREVSETNADIIGFRISPRLNAAGRMDAPRWAIELLLTEGEEAKQIADKLEEFNKKRQTESEAAVELANSLIEGDPMQSKAVIIHSKDFHPGVIGLIASRIADAYFRPAFIMDDKGEILTGSVRCDEAFNAVHALESAREYLTEFGGHAGAAGFSLKKEHLEDFKTAIHEYADSNLEFMDLQPVLNIDCEVKEGEICMDFCDEIEQLGPFGIGNDKPVFLLRGAKVMDVEKIGQLKNHLRFSIDTEKRVIQAIAFKFGQHAEKLTSGEPVDIVFQIQKNNWNDQQILQMKIVDFKV